ncbi:MAG: nonstructural protein [Microvirus sp.]|nr:MAG: nonstructural protein [Microvirus sp.]
MKLGVFTVFDSKSLTYYQPFYMASVGAAVRAFADSVNEKGHAFNLHPEDYTLFQVADYDDNTAIFSQFPNLNNLGVATSFISV